MLARELDPVGQSVTRCTFEPGWAPENKKREEGSSTHMWYTTPCSVAILPSLLLQSKDVVYPCKSAAVACRREGGNHGRHLEQNGLSHAPARVHPWPLQPLLGSVFSARRIWRLNGWGETTDKFAFLFLFPFERFSRIRYTDLFTRPHHISFLPLPKQQWEKKGAGICPSSS